MIENIDTALQITRVLDAPRERVWEAWTDPRELARWWWPEHFQTTYEVDLCEGGSYRFKTVELPDMGVLDVSGTFLEVRPPERLVYTWQWEGAPGPETRVTVELVDRGGQTELRLQHDDLGNREARDMHLMGWNDCIDRLEARLKD